MTDTGFRLSLQQALCWHSPARAPLGARGLFALPPGATAGDVRVALRAVVARHEILRTQVKVTAGMPLQFVEDTAANHWREAPCGVDIDSWLVQPHDAATPLSATWLPGTAEPVLLLSVNGLCGDAATLRVIMNELRGWLNGAVSDGPPVQYADYAQWQHESREGIADVLECQPAASPVHRAPLPLSRSVGDGFERRELLVKSGCALAESSVLAAWALLLARHADQPDITLGIVHDGRTEEVTDACGPYAGVYGLSLRYSEAMAWATWEQAIQQSRAASLEAAHLSLKSRFELQYSCVDSVDGERVVAVEAVYGWRLEVLRQGAHLTLRLAYDHSRIGADAAAAMAHQLNALLDADRLAAVAIGKLPLLAGDALVAAAAGLCAEGDVVQALSGRTALLHELIQQQGLRQPGRIAVRCDGRQVSYAELEQRACALAARLVAGGAGPEQVVAVCLQRSVDLVIALLAVLKAGAAYLPLDPDYPPERLAYALEDSGARQVLVHAATASRLAPGVGTIAVDEPQPLVSPTELPRPHLDQLAYIIYTSGSTGRPKGVAITHRNALHSTLARHRWYRHEVKAFLLLSSVAFDSSVAGIFWTLTQGGELVLPPEGDHRDVAALAGLIEAHQVSHLLALPSLYAQLLEERARLSSLTEAIVAGEACPAALARAHAAALPQALLVNEYGPTEVSVWSIAHRVSAQDDPVPIGRPIPGIRAYVLDETLRPLPAGIAGELYLGGPALARGYLGRPDLTAERFIPHPFAHGERLYRTGDRVRIRADARLDFLGRLDDQVKLRGFRIELGEIEARLAEQPGVVTCVAVVREDRPGEQRIVAYVTQQEGVSTAETLRAGLARSMPDFLLPSAIVTMAELPRMPNGKVDRRSLPAPENAPHRHRVAPRSVEESLIAAIWSDLLGLPCPGVHDNFFESGGHSLLATQVVNRVRKSFSVELAVREFFASPTVAGLAELVLSRRRSANGPIDAPLAPAPRGEALPLSFAQQRLWFLAQLDPEDPSYHIPGLIHIEGRLDVPAWSAAFQALQDRHEILRTCFPATASGTPVLRIAARPLLELQFEDLSGSGDAAAEAARRSQVETVRPFTLSEGPPMRASLLRLGQDRYHLVLVMHHIISDGWSTERLLQDWTLLYMQALAGHPLALTPLQFQYADHAYWQRQHLTEQVLADELAHWRVTLGEEQPLLALPTDRPRPPVLSGRGGRVPFEWSGEFSQKVRAFAHRRNATLFMLLECVFAALLSRQSGQADIRVGTPVAGRDRLELEPLVGLFVDTVVLRHRLSPLDSLVTLLDAGRRCVLDATQHRQLPFERLVDALAPSRDLSHQPLFQAMFDLQTERFAALAAVPGLSMSVQAIHIDSSKFDLSLSCSDDGDTVGGCFEYSADLFDHATVARMAQQYEALLSAAVELPDRPLADLPLLSDAQVRSLSRAPTVDLPLSRGFPVLFEAIAKQYADQAAVSDVHARLTYQELFDRASALAGHLQAAGATEDAPVAILLPRSNDYLVAILACLLAGSAWLPLDTALPRPRLVQMLAQADARLLIAAPEDETAAWVCAELPAAPGRLAPDAVAGPVMRPAAPSPDRLAYIIFTSGSTGTPKGAMVSQAGMLNNLLGKIDQLQLSPLDRIAQTASPCFDISVWQFLTGVLCGAQVVIIPDEVVRDAATLLQTVNRAGVSVLESVPSLMRGMLCDPDVPVQLPTLRYLLPTGEALPPELARQWFDRFPMVPLLNAYGPAECADDVALWLLKEAPRAGITHLPIGRPAANLQLYAVNDSFQLQPPGVTGELVIGGVGVGRGYLGDPALTAERFLPNPFGAPGSRLYRSGDLVRQSTDGVFTFLGRRDHQVKIRGFRVEPGEVEARLLQHPGVKGAAVLPQGDPARLMAYVEADVAVDGQVLRRFLAEELPDYMVPAVVSCLARFPLNANGKLDRRRLAALPIPAHTIGTSSPLTPVQAEIAGIWASVLGFDTVGLHDNFFSLGGDSILVIQVVSRARDAGLKLTARSLFLHQTVEALAAVAERLEPVQARPAPVGRVPLTPIQLAFFELHGDRPHHWNQSVLLTPARPLDERQLRQTVELLADRHDALRLRFSRQGSTWIQAYVAATPDMLLVSQTVAGAGELAAACDAIQASLDITRGPLWRVGLLRLPDGQQRVLMACHHLVVDGLSLRILIDDFAHIHQCLSDGGQPQLSPRAASFQDWSWDLQQRAAQGEFDAELPFWQEQTAVPLPVDHPDGCRFEGDADKVSVRLSRETTLRLLRCGELRAKPDDFLLAALAHALAQWSGADAVLVEQESHGRPEHLEAGNTVGWFTTAYPVRLPIDVNAPAAAQLKRIKQVLRAVPRAGLGHGVLRHLRHTLAGAPPQVSFNYLGQLDASVDGKLFCALDTDSGCLYDPRSPRSSEFDLNSYVVDGRLRLDWRYSRERYRRATVQSLANGFIERLAQLIEHVGPAQEGDLLTPQDFPEAALDDAALAHLLDAMD